MAELSINATVDSCNDARASYQLDFQYNSSLPSSAVNIHVQSSTANLDVTCSIYPTLTCTAALQKFMCSTVQKEMVCCMALFRKKRDPVSQQLCVLGKKYAEM